MSFYPTLFFFDFYATHLVLNIGLNFFMAVVFVLLCCSVVTAVAMLSVVVLSNERDCDKLDCCAECCHDEC